MSDQKESTRPNGFAIWAAKLINPELGAELEALPKPKGLFDDAFDAVDTVKKSYGTAKDAAISGMAAKALPIENVQKVATAQQKAHQKAKQEQKNKAQENLLLYDVGEGAQELAGKAGRGIADTWRKLTDFSQSPVLNGGKEVVAGALEIGENVGHNVKEGATYIATGTISNAKKVVKKTQEISENVGHNVQEGATYIATGTISNAKKVVKKTQEIGEDAIYDVDTWRKKKTLQAANALVTQARSVVRDIEDVTVQDLENTLLPAFDKVSRNTPLSAREENKITRLLERVDTRAEKFALEDLCNAHTGLSQFVAQYQPPDPSKKSTQQSPKIAPGL